MAMHDWMRVEPGIFHAFHLNWIARISETLNSLLPKSYYALPEQRTGPFAADILTLQLNGGHESNEPQESDGGTATLTRPKTRFSGEATLDFFRHRQRTVAIRHVSGDRLVAVIEVVSPGNKSSRAAVEDFVGKVGSYLNHGIHVSFVDSFPPSKLNPGGLHAEVWSEMAGSVEGLPETDPLAVVSYECAESLHYYVDPFKVGDSLPDMPVALQPGRFVSVPLNDCYRAAFAALPNRWADVLNSPASSE